MKFKTSHFKTYKSCGVIEPHKVTKVIILWNRYMNIVRETKNYWNGFINDCYDSAEKELGEQNAKVKTRRTRITSIKRNSSK